MKVPFPTNENYQSVSVNSKSLINCNNTIRTAAFQGFSDGPNSCYEPKSVLELRQSPSPVADKPASNADIPPFSDDPLQLGDHVLSDFENWDSLMKELGLHEDSGTASKPITPLLSHSDNSHTQYASFPDFPSAHSFDSAQFMPSEFNFPDTPHYPPLNNHNSLNSFDFSNEISNWNTGFDFVDELIRLAECFETNAPQLGHVILARLNQRLKSAAGKPLQRAAFYFKEALHSLLTGSNRMTRPSTSSEVIQSIKAFKTFSNISPVLMFSSFTANQALLEAVDGSAVVHVIDFDVGFGGHWASFMKELADKAEMRKSTTPILRITALVPEEYAVESRLIRENLSQFASDLNMRFEIDFVLIRTFELLSFKSIKFMDGEKTAVLLSPSIFRRVGSGFLSDLRRISPHVVVHVDNEGLMGFSTCSFRQTVIDGLEFFSTLLESLEAANVSGDWMRKIEVFVLFPRILEIVGAAGQRGTPWREAFVATGLRPVGLSQFADFQAECLLGRVQVRGFHVAKRQGEMLLCWHDRALVATSAWRC